MATTLGNKLELPVRFIQQELRNWCWAASMSMIHEYVKAVVMEQCTIAGSILNTHTCCSDKATCNKRVDSAVLLPWLVNAGIRATRRPGVPASDAIKRVIDTGSILMAGVQLPELGGHLVIIKGYELISGNFYLSVCDPWHGERQTLYQTLQRVWQESWIIFKDQVPTPRVLAKPRPGMRKRPQKIKRGRSHKLFTIRIGKKTRLTQSRYRYIEMVADGRIVQLQKFTWPGKKYHDSLQKQPVIQEINRIVNNYGKKEATAFDLFEIPSLLIFGLFQKKGRKSIFHILDAPAEYGLEKQYASFESLANRLVTINTVDAITLN